MQGIHLVSKQLQKSLVMQFSNITLMVSASIPGQPSGLIIVDLNTELEHIAVEKHNGIWTRETWVQGHWGIFWPITISQPNLPYKNVVKITYSYLIYTTLYFTEEGEHVNKSQ